MQKAALLSRYFSNSPKIPWITEMVAIQGFYERIPPERVYEFPESGVDKEKCTPIIILRRDYEAMLPYDSRYDIF